MISKIVTKTRTNLTETEAPVVPSHSVQVHCYCRSLVSKNLNGCYFCPEWFQPKCLGLSKSELGEKKTMKSRTSRPPMQQFVNPVSPKNKTPPVTHISPPSKARRLSTNEKEVKLLLQHTNKEPSKPVDTPEEIVPEIVKQAQV